ncbi:mediator of RNA polymerase II transcription subunit 1-domain-containing protein [Podospora appendiculata]|uniref:Mediator of RNA polymerase II transcription subunit 1 n=1 Tax=Podospora appendiculata TaxID=314037 RepID=A0AAE1C9R0_9PEZI|nr:mediator of RNA polymerase II transcription subunit 1-domain-containing protein [Podospora appendiculata]
MATPMKHALSQQGRTPSQMQHGAAATPPVSTPFSVPHLSPHGARSSPHQVKKSPATTTNMGGHPSSSAAVNFDSPSAAAAFGALHISGGLDMGLQGLNGLGTLTRSAEDERAKRLEEAIALLSRNQGLVSEAGLERLAKRLGLDCMFETSMGPDQTRTLIVAGVALELLVVFSNDIVQSVSLAFPESADIVIKHADEAGGILLRDLQLEPGQSPLTKKLDNFAANFERLAILDKLSVSPGLNLYEAVAGIYESLNRLHQWELQKAREDLALTGKSDEYLDNLVMCTRSGTPAMNARDRVGLSLDYWKERRLQLSTSPQMAARIARTEKIWSILIGCSPLGDIGLGPVRISDKWIAVDMEKTPLPGDIHSGPILDWLEPQNTFIPGPPQDQHKSGPGVDAMHGVLRQRLPEVAFHAIFDPPIHISLSLWDRIRQVGCSLSSTDLQLKSYDNLVFPVQPGSNYDLSEPRTITCKRMVEFTPPGEIQWSLRAHTNTLYIYKPIYGKTLTDLSFSHPQQLVNMLPYLRQYAFLSTLLENSFKERPGPSTIQKKPTMTSKKTTTRRDDFITFISRTDSSDPSHSLVAQNQLQQEKEATANEDEHQQQQDQPLKIDVTLTVHPVPRLQVVFPFREITANILLEIRENGQVHIEAQNVLDESNATAPNGRPRRVEDLGKALETIEDIGKWCEFIRTRWA